MPLKCPEFIVQLAAPTEEDPNATEEHRVRVLHGDQLRAELEGPKHKLSRVQEAPMHYSDLWCWAALTRTGVVKSGFQEFKRSILAVEAYDKDDPDHKDHVRDDELEDGRNETDPMEQAQPSD